MTYIASIRPQVLLEVTDAQAGVITTILGHFINTADSCLKRLEQSSDEALRAKILHELKGAALSIGADRISNICKHDSVDVIASLEDAIAEFKNDEWVRNALQK